MYACMQMILTNIHTHISMYLLFVYLCEYINKCIGMHIYIYILYIYIYICMCVTCGNVNPLSIAAARPLGQAVLSSSRMREVEEWIWQAEASQPIDSQIQGSCDLGTFRLPLKGI